jgi:hypothetical protein
MKEFGYRENNIDESKIVFIHGRIEDIDLPVDKVKNQFLLDGIENLVVFLG